MGAATVATTSSRALLAGCAQLGLDRDTLLEAAGLSSSEVDDPDGRLPLDCVGRLWQAAFDSSGDAALGLQIARAVPFGAYRVIDFLAASAPTVGDGLVRVARYFPIITSALMWEIDDARETITLRLLPNVAAGAPPVLPRPYLEFALTVTILHCRHATGVTWPVQEVTFPFEAPVSPSLHEDTFGCRVRFRHANAGFTVTRDTWQMPNGAASRDLLRTLEEHAARLMASINAANVTSSQVAKLILEELEGGDPSLPTVARRLAMSPRTLQRRLDDEGTTFAKVLDQTRRHVAEAYVADRGLALTEVAYLLGFSEPSAFTRACQRWFGQSPKQCRAQLAAR
jgi:AraC-like DNA-binding protein